MNPLKRLIALRDCPRNLIAEARRFLRNAAGNPVSDGSLGSIRVEDITHALCLYRQGSLSEMELQEWADILEMCDYIDYEQGSESTIADLLFRLSSPDINEPIDRLFAEKLLKTVANDVPPEDSHSSESQ